MDRSRARLMVVGACVSLAACGGTAGTGSGGGGSPGGGASSTTTTTASSGGGATTSTSASTGTGGSGTGGGNACALADDTTATAEVSASGCHVESRDTSACEAARQAQGLSGFWLKFSCRVTLSVATENGASVVKAATDDQPDYPSNYFPASSPCHESYTAAIQNPNDIAAQSDVIEIPLAPDTSSHAMAGGTVGIAMNGVVIFDNAAGPGDDIYTEAKTFDRCGGHPQMTGVYHYHGEPYAISDDDDAFIGVLRDGYPVYGRKDPDGSVPTDLDADGGHTGVTADSPSTPVYHYHLNLQTSTGSATAGQMQWFLTTGTYHGTPAACGSCM